MEYESEVVPSEVSLRKFGEVVVIFTFSVQVFGDAHPRNFNISGCKTTFVLGWYIFRGEYTDGEI